MNLNQFESYVDPKVLLRGQDYYRNGHVEELSEFKRNVYVALVIGTEEYSVMVKLDKNQNIVDSQCDCPYDFDDLCKHKVAVFLAIHDLLQEAKSNSKSNQTSLKVPLESLDTLLGKRSKEQLMELLLALAKEDSNVNQYLLIELTEDSEMQLRLAKECIRDSIRMNKDRNGFIDYNHARVAVEGALQVNSKAKQQYQRNNPVLAVQICLLVIDEMVRMISYCDDSDGSVGMAIEEAFMMIEGIVTDHNSQKDSDKIFQHLLREGKKTMYEGWSEWRFNLWRFAAHVATKPKQRERLEAELVAYTKEDQDDWMDQFNNMEALKIQSILIERFDGPEASMKFILDRKDMPEFRRMLLRRYTDEKQYEQAIDLALDGELHDTKNHIYVREWQEFRLNLYRITENPKKFKELAEILILDGNFALYLELKKRNEKKWEEYYPQLLVKLEAAKKQDSSLYASILVEEKRFGQLLEYVKRNVRSIENYAKWLVKDYSEDVYRIYQFYIRQVAKGATTRREYQGVATIIRNLVNHGGKKEAKAIIDELYSTYPRRAALLDELSKIRKINSEMH